jgi:hypothetical protein
VLWRRLYTASSLRQISPHHATPHITKSEGRQGALAPAVYGFVPAASLASSPYRRQSRHSPLKGEQILKVFSSLKHQEVSRLPASLGGGLRQGGAQASASAHTHGNAEVARGQGHLSLGGR